MASRRTLARFEAEDSWFRSLPHLVILGLTSDAVKRNLPLLRCGRGLQAGKETALGMIVVLVQLGCAAIEKVLFVSLSSKSVSLLGKFPLTKRGRDSG